MFAEIVVAAAAAIAWTWVDSSVARHLLFNVIVMASLSTLLFNANPLMRFDGYYILSDLLGIPNLAMEGNRFLKSSARHLFFGENHRPLQVLGMRSWFVRSYGIGAAMWRLLICVSLTTAASVLLHGAGLLLAVFGVFSWFGMPLLGIARELGRRFHEHRPSFIRATVLAATLAAVIVALLVCVPWPGMMKAPVVVDYADTSVVLSAAPGFVQRVLVANGQSVAEGQLLLELRNDDLTAELRELELSYRQTLVEHRVALDQRSGGSAQIAARNLQAIKERLAEARKRTNGLQVRAPVAGRIVARNLRQTTGTYVKEGAELLSVADEARKELVVSVGQEDIEALMLRVGDQTRFRVRGLLACSGQLVRLDPRASTALPHPAMSSSVGGALAVTERNTDGDQKTQLVEPRFRGVVALSPDVCHDLAAGEQGYAILGLRQESIGEYAWARIHRWFETLLRPPTS